MRNIESKLRFLLVPIHVYFIHQPAPSLPRTLHHSETSLGPFSTALRGLVTLLAGSEVAAASAAATGLLGTLGTLAAGIAGLYYGLHPASTQSQEQEDQTLGGPLYKRFPNLGVPTDKDHPVGLVPGSNPTGGGTFAPAPRIAPNLPGQRGPTGSASDPIHVQVQNGKDLADGVTKRQTDQASRSMTGSTAGDVRFTPLMPGLSPFAAMP